VALIMAAKQVQVAEQMKLEAKAHKDTAQFKSMEMLTLSKARETAGKSALDPKYVFDEQQHTIRNRDTAMFQALGRQALVPQTVLGGGGNSNGVTSSLETLMSFIAATEAKKFNQASN